MTEQKFRDEEIVVLRHYSKERQEYVSNVYPKVGGRLRLAHEANDVINIETEIYKYDGSIAIVIAVTKTLTGRFTGIGMASVERDQKIAPAILELAETRAIARSLRFSGYGVEYASAEEISHLQNGNGASPNTKAPDKQHHSQPAGGNGSNSERKPTGNGNNGGNGNGYRKPENGGGRLSPKQYKFLINLSDDKNIPYEDLNQKALNTFGVALEHLSKNDASSMIQELQSQ